jgi:hypothetical protein
LDDEHIPPPSVPVDAHEDLSVCEVTDGGTIRGLPDELTDLFSQGPIRAAGEQKEWTSLIGVVHRTLPLGFRCCDSARI